MRKYIRLAAVAVAAAGLGTLLAANADAATPDLHLLRHVSYGFCLANGSDRHVVGDDCTGGVHEAWAVVPVGRGVVLRTADPDYCLESQADGDTYTNLCSDESPQRWYVHRSEDGYVLENATFNRCLAGDQDGTIYTTDCRHGDVWRIE